jgi:hypothetical protein
MPAPRLVCSDAERRYAVWAHDDLRARGHEAWVETLWIRPQRAGGVALSCLLAAVGGLVALGAPIIGLVMAALGAVSLLIDAAGRTGPMRFVFPRRATQVVLVGGEEAAVELVLVARTDVPRGGLARRLGRVPGGLWWLSLAALAVVAAAAARVADVDGTPLGAAQLGPTVVLLVAATVALDSVIAAPGDGAEEERAVAAVLAAHEALVREPPPGIAAGLLLGAPDAVRAHLRREHLDPRRAALLFARSGPARTRHQQWRAAASAAGLQVRRGGSRGLPSIEAPAEDAERLARALDGVVS